MKTFGKMIVAGIIIAIIGAVILISAVAINGWKWFEGDFEMQTYTCEDEYCGSLDVHIGAGSVKTEFYDGDKIVIDYPTSKGYKTDIHVKDDGTLKVEAKKKWYNFIHYGTVNIPTMVIKLPQSGTAYDFKLELGAGTAELANGGYGNITLDIAAGTFKANSITCANLACDIAAGTAEINQLICNKLDCDVAAGNTKIEKLSCGETRVDVAAGNVDLGYTDPEADFNITVDKGAGKCNVSDRHDSSATKSIYISVAAGNAHITFNN